MSKWIILAGLLVLANAQAGELYRSIDKEGKVHYSDKPPVDMDDAEQLNFGKAPVPDEVQPYETQRARQNFPVTLYTFPDCGMACQAARDYLNKRGVPFTEKNLVTKDEYEAFSRESGTANLPAATVGKTWLKGFLADEWGKQLDYAGYPKNAQPFYRPPQPASGTVPAQ